MAKIDYNGIKDELKKVILDANLSIAHEVSIEGDILFDNFDTLIDIEIDSREIQSAPIAQGTKVRLNLLVIITIWAKHFEQEESKRIRDSLLGEVELVIMRNRTLNGKVDSAWLLGGQNVAAYIENENAFVSAGEIKVNLESEIIT